MMYLYNKTTIQLVNCSTHNITIECVSCFHPITRQINTEKEEKNNSSTLHAAPSNSHAFSTNYHACIAMPTWGRCAPPILFWPWPPYNLLSRSCLTWIFFVDPHWWVPLCVQCPAKAMPFKQIIIHALQCQHDIDVHLLFCFDIDLHLTCSQVQVHVFFVDSHSMCHFDKLSCMYILQCPHDIHVLVHLFCFDLHKFLLRSRAATCPTSNCGRRSLFMILFEFWDMLGYMSTFSTRL